MIWFSFDHQDHQSKYDDHDQPIKWPRWWIIDDDGGSGNGVDKADE